MDKIVQKIEAKKPLIPVRKRVCAYARVSSGKDEMLHSLSAQISYYSEYIQSRGDWLYVGVYADSAVTGTKDSRDEFQRMLEDCRNGKIDMVMTKSISRFARNTVTLLQTVRELKELGVDVWFEKENIHSISGDGELMLTIDDEDRDIIAFSPYTVDIDNLSKGKHTVEFVLYGTRINTFGGMHNVSQQEWVGPDFWRSTGDNWCYEYILKDTGILASPVIEIFKK